MTCGRVEFAIGLGRAGGDLRDVGLIRGTELVFGEFERFAVLAAKFDEITRRAHEAGFQRFALGTVEHAHFPTVGDGGRQRPAATISAHTMRPATRPEEFANNHGGKGPDPPGQVNFQNPAGAHVLWSRQARKDLKVAAVSATCECLY